MKNGIVIYKSKTGLSQRYAQWIASALEWEALNLEQFVKSKISEYGLIIYGGGVYAGQIAGIGKIKRWMEDYPNKTWVVFATGATPASEGYKETVSQSNFRKGEVRPAHFYYYLAGINYEKMGPINRVLMKIFTRFAAKKQGVTVPAKVVSVDLSNPEYIEELVRYVQLKRR